MASYTGYYGTDPAAMKANYEERNKFLRDAANGHTSGKFNASTGQTDWSSTGGGANGAAGSMGAAAPGAGGAAGGADYSGGQAVQSLQSAAGGGGPVQPPPDVTGQVTIPGVPGQMRPNLATRQPPPEDGGLRALQRKVY